MLQEVRRRFPRRRSPRFVGEVPRRTSFIRRVEGAAGRRAWPVEICLFFSLFFLCGMKIDAHGVMVLEDTCHQEEAEVREE